MDSCKPDEAPEGAGPTPGAATGAPVRHGDEAARSIDLSAESVAGEEDPGAGMDMAIGQGGLSGQQARALGPQCGDRSADGPAH